MTSHAIRVTSHMRDGAECCVATRPMHVKGERGYLGEG